MAGLLEFIKTRAGSLKVFLARMRNLILIRTSSLFVEEWYLERNPEVTKTGLTPALHYLLHGGFEGRDPGPGFSSSFYLSRYKAVKLSGINPLVHYIRSGKKEGKHPFPSERFSNNFSLSKAVTFFYTEESEFLVAEQIATVAKERGYKVAFSSDFEEPAEIGFFFNHSADPHNARFSITMLHDLGQEQWPVSPSREPNLWSVSSWNWFDIGILPGPAWSQCWISVSAMEYARPHLGVFELGWPKADNIFNDRVTFENKVDEIRKSLKLSYPLSVLYAPSWENDSKLNDLIDSVKDLPVNVLVKEAYWPDEKNRARISKITEKLQIYGADKIHVIDPKLSIMYCLALADVIVSDESNCLAEALLFEVPGIAVADWLIPAIPSLKLPARLPEPPPFSIITTRSELKSAVEKTLFERESLRPSLRELREQYFSHLGYSSKLIMDVLDAALNHEPFPIEPLIAQSTEFPVRS